MTRKIFYSFHYQNDNWRVQQVRNIDKFESNPIAYENNWETIKNNGDRAIKNWINQNLEGRTCLVVLIGSETSERYYVQYEIETAWNRGMGVCGIFIHNLGDRSGKTSRKGNSPFEKFVFDNTFSIPFYCPIFDPKPNTLSLLSGKFSYLNEIKNELPSLIEDAIRYRKECNKMIRKIANTR